MKGTINFLTGTVIISLLSGCVVVQAPPPNGSTTTSNYDVSREVFNSPPKQVSATPVQPVTNIKPVESAEPKSRISTVSETSQVCQLLTEDGLPLECTIIYLENSPTLFVVFQDEDALIRFLEGFVDVIAGPFCNATNSVNREGLFLVGIKRLSIMKAYQCELNTWTDWFTFDKDGNLVNL